MLKKEMASTIHKKIVLDENDKPLEVIISYEEWKRIEHAILGYSKTMTREKLGMYAGILNIKEDPLEYQKRLRDEWK